MIFELTEAQHHNLLQLLARVDIKGVAEASALIDLYVLFQQERSGQDGQDTTSGRNKGADRGKT